MVERHCWLSSSISLKGYSLRNIINLSRDRRVTWISYGSAIQLEPSLMFGRNYLMQKHSELLEAIKQREVRACHLWDVSEPDSYWLTASLTLRPPSPRFRIRFPTSETFVDFKTWRKKLMVSWREEVTKIAHTNKIYKVFSYVKNKYCILNYSWNRSWKLIHWSVSRLHIST